MSTKLAFEILRTDIAVKKGRLDDAEAIHELIVKAHFESGGRVAFLKRQLKDLETRAAKLAQSTPSEP